MTQALAADAQETGPQHALICARLQAVRARMDAACARSGRSAHDVTLVAVSKSQPIEAVAAAVACGQRDFGENRLPELWQKVHAAYQIGLGDLRWHFIGALQSRQTGAAVGPLALIHAVDRLKIAQRLERLADQSRILLPALLEVNVSGEASKHGFNPDELRAQIDLLSALPNLDVQGLMTMAPLVEDPEAARPIFRALAALRAELSAASGLALPHLSMGMSNDFEVAIEEGATLVRIGTAIFGERDAAAPHPEVQPEQPPYVEKGG